MLAIDLDSRHMKFLGYKLMMMMMIERQTYIFNNLKGMSDERQSQPIFVGVVELPHKIGPQNR